MMCRPFFSIIMCTHIRPRLLERALKSLRAQSFDDFEIILVADALDTGTAMIASNFLSAKDIFFKRSGEPGPAVSRNIGLQLAKGEWIVFLDDDDTFKAYHLNTLYCAIQNSDSPVLFTDLEIVTEDRTQLEMEPISRQFIETTSVDIDSLWVKNFIPNHALAFKKTILEGISFDSHLLSLEDWDFLLAVSTRSKPIPYTGGGVLMHKDYINIGNRRGTQEESQNDFCIRDYIYIYRRWLAPNHAIRSQRKLFLDAVGVIFPADWF